jgi:predicted site-specific integrase-resolvase
MNTDDLMYPVFLNQSQLSRRWGLSERTLERWRYVGVGPVPTKIGGRVRYRITDVESFENAGRLVELR